MLKNISAVQRLIATWHVGLARLIGIEYEVRGAELLEQLGPAIVVLNHQSTLDNCGMDSNGK